MNVINVCHIWNISADEIYVLKICQLTLVTKSYLTAIAVHFDQADGTVKCWAVLQRPFLSRRWITFNLTHTKVIWWCVVWFYTITRPCQVIPQQIYVFIMINGFMTYSPQTNSLRKVWERKHRTAPVVKPSSRWTASACADRCNHWAKPMRRNEEYNFSMYMCKLLFALMTGKVCFHGSVKK